MPVLKIAIAQLNYTIGDFAGNRAAIVGHIQKAAADHADMVVFSELSLCGYYPGDLLEEPSFLEKLDSQLDAILRSTRNAPVLAVIGAPRRRTGPGKPLHNALLALRRGEIAAEYFKQLLPTYGVFDEGRHFE